MIRISDNENQLISAGDLITKEDLEIISKSIKEIEDEVSQEIGHPINKDLN